MSLPGRRAALGAALGAALTLLLAVALAEARPASDDTTTKVELIKTVSQLIAETLDSTPDEDEKASGKYDPQVALMEQNLAKVIASFARSSRTSRTARDVADIEHGPKPRTKRNLLQILSEALLLRPQVVSEYLPGYVDGY